MWEQEIIIMIIIIIRIYSILNIIVVITVLITILQWAFYPFSHTCEEGEIEKKDNGLKKGNIIIVIVE